MSIGKAFGALDAATRQLVRGSVSTAVIRGLSLGATFVGSVVAARLLGPAEFGLYSLILTVTTLLALPLRNGLPTLFVREASNALSQADWSRLHGIWQWAHAVIASAALLASLAAAAFAWWASASASALDPALGFWLVVLVTVGALCSLRSSQLRVRDHLFAAQFPGDVLDPLIFAAALSILVSASSASALAAVQAKVIAGGVVLVVLAWRVRAARAAVSFDGRAASFAANRRWLWALAPLTSLGALNIVNQHTDILMLGYLMTTEQVGYYKIAATAGTLVSLGLTTANFVIGPKIAKHHAVGDVGELQRACTFGVLLSVSVAFGVALTLGVFGADLIALAYGDAYAAAMTPMMVLITGHIVNAACGSPGTVLIMIGRDRAAVRVLAMSGVINIILNLALIPLLGIIGAALATVTAMVTWNLLLRFSVKRELGVETSLLSALFAGRIAQSARAEQA